MRFFWLISLFVFPACGPSFFINLMVPTLGKVAQSSYKNTDPEFMAQALPGNLMMLEGMLELSPNNPELLLLVAQGKCGYALAFLEDQSPTRAKKYYEEGKKLALKALSLANGKVQKALEKKKPLREVTLAIDDPDLVPYLFWLGNCWGSWLNLSLTDPKALLQAADVVAIMSRVLDLNPSYYYGGAYIFFGAYYAGLPELAGGGLKKAYPYFEKAFQITNRTFLLVHYMYAKTYLLLLKDLEDPVTGKPGITLFDEIYKEVQEFPLEKAPELGLINAVVKKRMEILKKERDLLSIEG